MFELASYLAINKINDINAIEAKSNLKGQCVSIKAVQLPVISLVVK